MSLAGNLRTMPFADLLQFIAVNLSTGTLQVRHQQTLKMIFFEKGKVISSSSSDPKDYLGHFLVSQGYITEDDLRVAMEIQRSSKMLLGKILVMSGKVSEKDMVRLLQIKTEETVYSLFLWDEGEFTFYQDEFVNRLFVRIHLDPQSLIFEGVMRRDEWQRIRAAFPGSNVVLEKDPGVYPDLDSEATLTRMIYDLVDGRRALDEIAMAAHSVEFPVYRTLFRFYEEGYLRIAEEQIESPTEKKIYGGEFTVTQLLSLGKEGIQKGRFEEALDLLRTIPATADDYTATVVPLLELAEKGTLVEIYSRVLPPDKVLQLLIPLEQIASVHLTPQEGFLLSRIDGHWDIRSILSITPMKEVDALRLIKRLVDRGIVGIKGAPAVEF